MHCWLTILLAQNILDSRVVTCLLRMIVYDDCNNFVTNMKMHIEVLSPFACVAHIAHLGFASTANTSFFRTSSPFASPFHNRNATWQRQGMLATPVS